MLSSISLASRLHELKTKYLVESQWTDTFHANLYIPAQGMVTQHAPEEEYFDLWGRLETFMAPGSPQRVCVILGAAGAGKSTFSHYLAVRLWEAYDKDPLAVSKEDITKPIPVFVPLANLHDPTRHNQDLVAELFRQQGWPDDRIWKAREELEFVFILDGYDEIKQRDRNFYIDNRIGEWNARIVITSRPEYLGSGYEKKLYPPGQSQLLQEYWLAPFSTTNITDYISKYVQFVTANDTPGAPSRTMTDYERFVQKPELRVLLSNPFLLRVAMTSETEFKRGTLYRRFLDHWFQSAQERLSRMHLPSALAGPFDMLCEQGFTEHAEAYCFDFAVELYRHQSLQASYFPNPGRSAPKKRANAIWGKFLADEDPKRRLLRYSSPLLRMGQSYSFLHKSVRDFAIAQSMLQDDPLCAPDALLNEFCIADDHGIIDFIVEEAMQNQGLQTQLLACVEELTQNPKMAKAAANAITILVRAGKQLQFHTYDLRGIMDFIVEEAKQNNELQAQLLACVEGLNPNPEAAKAVANAIVVLVRAGKQLQFHQYDLQGAMDFIIEEAKQNQELQVQLIACVEESKRNPEVAKAAANAITILVRAGKRFHEYDLRGIRIPGADIRAGWFEGAQLQGADLSQVRMDSIWLRGADLTGACIERGDFGEKPPFKLEGTTYIPITCFYTPDGELLVAAGSKSDTNLTVWSATNINRKPLHTPKAHNRVVTCVAFPLNGDPDLLASADITVRLWSRQNQVHALSRHNTTVRCLAFSLDAKFLVSGGDDNMLCLWSVAAHNLIVGFPCTTGSVHTVAFSPDGQTLASAGTSTHIELWSTESGKLLHTLRGHTGAVTSVAFAPNGQTFASASEDKCLKLWQVSGWQPIHSFTGHANGVQMIAFAPDSQLIAAASTDTIRIWSVASRKLVLVCEGIPLSKTGLVFSRNGELIATSTTDGIIRQWLVPQEAVQVGNDHTGAVNDLAFSRDKKLLVSASDDGTVRLWSMDPSPMPNLVNVLALPSASGAVAFSPDSAFLATGTEDGKVRLHRSFQDNTRSSESQDIVLGAHTIQVKAVAFTPDGNILASGSNDHRICLWSIQSGTQIQRLQDHTDLVRSVAFSPDGQLLVSGSDDKTIRLWSVPHREILYIYTGHTASVRYVVFSPDGEVIASASDDKTVCLWSVLHRKILHTFQGHTCDVTRIAFSPDGFLLASGSLDRSLRFWSLASRELVLSIDVRSEVRALAWTAGAAGALIAVGTNSGAVQLLQVIQKQGYSRENPAVEVSWLWATDQGVYLNVLGARVERVTGLSTANLELLKQRGAIGEPVVGLV